MHCAGDTPAASALARALRMAMLGMSLVVASCGGGDTAVHGPDSRMAGGRAGADLDDGSGEVVRGAGGKAAGRERVQGVFVPSGPIPADAPTKGMFSGVTGWPLIPIHAVMMPDGRVLSYGTDGNGRQTGNFIIDVWDPDAGLDTGHLTLPNGTGVDLFCSSQIVLPSGSGVSISGGDIYQNGGTTNLGNSRSTFFDPANNRLNTGADMNRGRWYATSTTLLNGEIFVMGGTGGEDRPEIRGLDGTYRLLANTDTAYLNPQYPRNFVGPDGRIFGFDGNGRMYYISPETGALVKQGKFNTVYAGDDGSAVMYRPGRILQVGGNSNGAAVIDIRQPNPIVTATGSLSSQRRHVTTTVLPDGKVLATGGSEVRNEMIGVNYIAEIWNPATGQWTAGASYVQARLYHSIALLMQDGTVLVGGGGAPGPQRNLNVELYYPPYLFTADRQLAPRPVIDQAPSVIDIGDTFSVRTSGAGTPAKVVLIKAGAVTHGWNMEQRYQELTFNNAGGTLTVQAPRAAAEAPPGHYLLFVLNDAGVPSVAKMMRINVVGAAQENAPSVTSPGFQRHTVGDTVDLQVQASDPDGDVLTYTATGLPPGLSLGAATGRITGQPETAGSYHVVLTVSDGERNATTAFDWSVLASAALVVSLPDDPPQIVAGGSATYTAATSGATTDLRFRWNFGDGSGDTAWSTSPTISHTYAAPGLYTVTVTAVDSRGIQKYSSYVQAVSLPATARPPASSTPIVWHPGSGSGPRLWVVNPDTDTVSVFDAASRSKLAEIPVGRSPRSVAVAPDGRVWVANKVGSTVSIIDPARLAVATTLDMPRASQPHGLAIGANGTAFVVLEGTGRLLKYDTSTLVRSGGLAIGSNPRHVAVTGDGGTVYIPRFITPPLPGEGTANVVVQSGATRYGGEVVVVAPGNMTWLRTLVLAHSDKQDFENQGRGIPNYLGAPVISPDGLTAWVPSKQDNILRGQLRDGQALNFQSTVRAISSRLNLQAQAEDLPARIDHDNASLASAAVYDPRGIYMFVALETSREVAVVDAHGKRELFRFDVGRAPQGLAVSGDGRTLYVSNFMDRSVSVFDLSTLIGRGELEATQVATLNAVANERLTATVLRGKQFFYDARDARLSRDRYMSCASCHADGSHDGRVWDMTDRGEGLRNTPSLRGRSGGQGFVHWSGNFDEIQDFEGQIRTLAGGTGLMSNADFNAGTRSQPLGTTKAGVSSDLDALAAYVQSLDAFEVSPWRTTTGTLTPTGNEGRAIFQERNCASCHSGAPFTNSAAANLVDIGTIKPSSGSRLGTALTGLDVPTLRDVWATAPYLHDGSAATLEAAVRAHQGVTIDDTQLAKLTTYLREIGSEEGPAQGGGTTTGQGLTGRYYNNTALTGASAATRVEAVDFDWGLLPPALGVLPDLFSVRWSGRLVPTVSGTYTFQTLSDDGVRLYVNGVNILKNWTIHTATLNTSTNVTLTAGQPVSITVEYFDRLGPAQISLRWRPPGSSAFEVVPASQLLPQ